jgi:2-isopropylmalate synthase
MEKLTLKDTTFRDGLQNEKIEITNIEDALKAIKAIDNLGIKYHEVGFVTANKNIQKLIKAACNLELSGKVCAFGRTHPDDIKLLIELHKTADLQTAVLVGKTRKRDAQLVLRKSPKENLLLIKNSIKKLVQSGLEVIYDGEHFFQAFWEDDLSYCLKTIETAFKAGASWIVLCDTNGKMNPEKIAKAIRKTKEIVPIENLGIHTHNDRGRAVINAETAWLEGVRLIEGTIGGVGERCGNMDICTFLPNIFFEYKAEGITKEQLKNLTPTYLTICDILNISPSKSKPWVGNSAFYTEAGMHQSGLIRDKGNYWHIYPECVGNRSRVGLSEQSGRANLYAKAKGFGISIPEDKINRIAKNYKELINEGANFGMADASFHLFLLRELNLMPKFFEFPGFRLVIEMQKNWPIQSEASLRTIINNKRKSFIAGGDGPVNALDNALRETFLNAYPKLSSVKLVDFKVRIVDSRGTASKVRVLITLNDKNKTWTTMAVHENIIAAAWKALLDGYIYKLVLNGDVKKPAI